MDMLGPSRSLLSDHEEASFAVRPAPRCTGCRDGAAFPVAFSMAFQPIVDPAAGRVFAYEALVRGASDGTAATVLASVTEQNRYAFDQRCRVRAIELAAELGLAEAGAALSINFMPNAIYRPDVCIRTTLDTARRVGFPTDRIIFEFTEDQQIREPQRVREILVAYRGMGFRTAIDDFGAGYAGLGLLADFQPDIIKLDMGMIRGVDRDRVRRAIVAGIVAVCAGLDIKVIAEGVETADEHAALADLGITLFQGFLFARPALEALPTPDWPERAAGASNGG